MTLRNDTSQSDGGKLYPLGIAKELRPADRSGMGQTRLRTDVRHIANLCGDDSPRPVSLAAPMAANGGYSLRARWLADEYQRLRNAAYLVRASRVGPTLNPIALLVVVQEADALAQAGEPLFDIFEAFAELLRAP